MFTGHTGKYDISVGQTTLESSTSDQQPSVTPLHTGANLHHKAVDLADREIKLADDTESCSDSSTQSIHSDDIQLELNVLHLEQLGRDSSV